MARRFRLAYGALLCLAAASPPPAEPAGYWAGAMAGAVPATLAGATVLADPAAVAAWMAANHPVLLDVSPPPKKPPVMAPGMPWLPPAHQDIPGSVWLPDAGRGLLRPQGAEAYRRAVEKLAGAPPGKPVLAYCHPRCWVSWNAAKFLIRAGYTRVAWFPGGIEAWAAAGHDMQPTQAMPY
jgi:PQQ-dependent catabolism-associated CXXCW motif protein